MEKFKDYPANSLEKGIGNYLLERAKDDLVLAMDKYESPDIYVMEELKQAQQLNIIYCDDMFEAAKRISSLEATVINQNKYIIELEEKLGIEESED